MARESFEFTLVSPEAHVLTEQVDMVVVPGEDGDFGVLANHAAIISTLRPGLVSLYQGNQVRHLFVTEGFVDVTEKKCSVLAETSEFVDQLSIPELEAKLRLIEEEIQVARSNHEQEELKHAKDLMMIKIRLIKSLTS